MTNIISLPTRQRPSKLRSLVEYLQTHGINQYRSVDECARSIGFRISESNRGKTRRLLGQARRELLGTYGQAILFEYVPRRGAQRGDGKISAASLFDGTSASLLMKEAAMRVMTEMVKQCDATEEELRLFERAITLISHQSNQAG